MSFCIAAFIDEFRHYWGLETEASRLPRSEEQVETVYGPVKVVHIGESNYIEWMPVARRWDISDRNVIWAVRRAMADPEQPIEMRG